MRWTFILQIQHSKCILVTQYLLIKKDKQWLSRKHKNLMIMSSFTCMLCSTMYCIYFIKKFGPLFVIYSFIVINRFILCSFHHL